MKNETIIGYNAVQMEVLRWAEARKIIPNSTSVAQARKTTEETAELLEAAASLRALRQAGVPETHPVYVEWKEKYRDAVGDVVVTLINGCALEDEDLVDCLTGSYHEIKHRTGTMNSAGIFVKD